MNVHDILFIKSVIGSKYSISNRNGFNCWGLVAAYYKVRNIIVPDYKISSLDVREISTTFTNAFIENRHGFKKVETPRDGDVVVLKSSIQMHCGLWLNGKILHSSPQCGGVVYQPLSQILGFKEIEYWSYDKD